MIPAGWYGKSRVAVMYIVERLSNQEYALVVVNTRPFVKVGCCNVKPPYHPPLERVLSEAQDAISHSSVGSSGQNE